MEDRELVQALLNRQESDDLDFKSQEYNLTNNHGRSRFIKDIVAMANTPRSNSAYILLGALEHSGRVIETPGVMAHPDESELGRIVSGRVRPTPKFSYRQVEYDGIGFGLIEIPSDQLWRLLCPVRTLRRSDRVWCYIRRKTQATESDTDRVGSNLEIPAR